MKKILVIQTFLLGSTLVVFIIALSLFFSTKNPLLAGNDTSSSLVLTPGMFLVFWILGVAWRMLVFASVQRCSRITQTLLIADMFLGIWNTLLLIVLFQERIFSVMMCFLAVSVAFGSFALKMICFVAERRCLTAQTPSTHNSSLPE